ncbi:EF-P lysine aminoacylase EpmA [Moraxella sp. ZY210820]|uniref:EF-P lysine aminoacylase EpmA n=1 Tax=unclassified Moraxella TaxID=2685852 RepID=UPI0027313E4F|nr:EF-P lysine aminoacylase EpmA [Moraxella sp. ZY210820]WLF84437.1 EF-P lysine aminoacylase GenX [Moraxella sp. ZY210820]
MNYQPNCSIEMLHARAKLYQTIRQFFAKRDVLEVETPLLSSAGTTDVHLSSIPAQRHINGQLATHYLQTSPEFAMKRLLASSSGAIYQICKVFRDDEHGRKHNSEFTMLEWYRPKFSLADLMQETQDLLCACLNKDIQVQVLSYKHAFQQHLNINPLQANLDDLKQYAKRINLDLDLGDDRLAYMDLLFSHCVEPYLGQDNAVFLTDFPPEMASLAKVKQDDDGEMVSARFELYINGLELANAYDELIDATILRQRFEQDNQQRERLGLVQMPIDEYLLSALPNMPACSGIALGIDRLLMVVTGQNKLENVVSFMADRV